jgi:hypothetical protein
MIWRTLVRILAQVTESPRATGAVSLPGNRAHFAGRFPGPVARRFDVGRARQRNAYAAARERTSTGDASNDPT